MAKKAKMLILTGWGWLDYAAAAALAANKDRYIKMLVVEQAESVKEATAEVYGVQDDAGLERRLCELVKNDVRAGEPWRTLLEAAMFAYRNYQDEAAYPRAIRHLALGESEERWSSEEKSLVSHYRLYGHRELVGKSRLASALLEQVVSRLAACRT